MPAWSNSRRTVCSCCKAEPEDHLIEARLAVAFEQFDGREERWA